MTTNLSLFISSKMTGELASERRSVKEALKEYNMSGWLWEDDAGACPEPTRSTYLTEVAACDIYIGIFWLGYGPYTMGEFKHAHEVKQKPCLIYEKYVDIHQRDPQLEKFLADIQQVNNPTGLTVCRFKTPEELAERVQRDVIGLLVDRFRKFEVFQKFLPTWG